MAMPTTSIYPGKQGFEDLQRLLPHDPSALDGQQRADLAMKAWSVFKAGLPYADRPVCIQHFFLLLPRPGDSAVAPTLVDAVSSSLSDMEVARYGGLLEGRAAHQVCQIRGEWQALALGLSAFPEDGRALAGWDGLKKDCEAFLASEAGVPLRFLEEYLRAYEWASLKSKTPEPHLYEIALRVSELSTDRGAIKRAIDILTDDEQLRTYKRATLDPESTRVLSELEGVEEAVQAEFGHEVKVHGAVGKAIGFLTSAGRERRAMQKEVQTEWVGRIRRAARSADRYASGFAEYLCSHVYMGTDDVKRAIKALDAALEGGFDPGSVLVLLVGVTETLKDKQGASGYAQRLLDHMNVGTAADAERDKYAQQLVSTIRAAGGEPKFASSRWDACAANNARKADILVSELAAKAQSLRLSDLERRTDAGLTLLDSLFMPPAMDVSTSRLDAASISLPLASFAAISLEEIDLFKAAGGGKLEDYYRQPPTQQALLRYVESVCEQRLGALDSHLDRWCGACPNVVASLAVLEGAVSKWVRGGNIGLAQKLLDFAVEKREGRKTAGLYAAARPLQKALRQQGTFAEEIALLSKTRRVIQEPELTEATIDLAEAYVGAVQAEKSVSGRDALLKAAETEHLTNERLVGLRAEVTAQLDRRKRILTKVAIAAAVVIAAAAVGAVLFFR